MQLNIQIPQTMLFLMVNDTHDSKSGGGGGKFRVAHLDFQQTTLFQVKEVILTQRSSSNGRYLFILT